MSDPVITHLGEDISVAEAIYRSEEVNHQDVDANPPKDLGWL